MEIQIDLPAERVTSDVAEKILDMQKRCIACGSTLYLHIHHRVSKSEGEVGVRKFLENAFKIFAESYGEDILKDFWYLHSIQNLVVLCRDCHEGDSGRGVHGGNEKLRQQLRYSFTCPITGFNVPFYRKKNLYTIY